MILQRQAFSPRFAEVGWDVHVPDFEQTLSEAELIDLVPNFDGWIIGDDPATRRVVEAGKSGRLKAAVKWGVGVDNVDFDAFRDHGIPVTNTPGMFGNEVADMALGYVIALARQTFEIDRGIRNGLWPKPAGVSLTDKQATVVGFGDIGSNTAARLAACGMNVVICDPVTTDEQAEQAGFVRLPWPNAMIDADFVVFTCALTATNRHMLGADTLAGCKPGLRVVNVARGPLIDESALLEAQRAGIVHSCALDVFENEPLEASSPLREFESNIFGSHNSSNTIDAVLRTSERAIALLSDCF
jgi:D-3-phosphoglycerate dehydrogenase